MANKPPPTSSLPPRPDRSAGKPNVFPVPKGQEIKSTPFPGMPDGPCPVGPRDPVNQK